MPKSRKGHTHANSDYGANGLDMSQSGMPPIISIRSPTRRYLLGPRILIQLDSIIRFLLPSPFSSKHIQPQFLLFRRILFRIKVSPVT